MTLGNDTITMENKNQFSVTYCSRQEYFFIPVSEYIFTTVSPPIPGRFSQIILLRASMVKTFHQGSAQITVWFLKYVKDNLVTIILFS